MDNYATLKRTKCRSHKRECDGLTPHNAGALNGGDNAEEDHNDRHDIDTLLADLQQSTANRNSISSYCHSKADTCNLGSQFKWSTEQSAVDHNTLYRNAGSTDFSNQGTNSSADWNKFEHIDSTNQVSSQSSPQILSAATLSSADKKKAGVRFSENKTTHVYRPQSVSSTTNVSDETSQEIAELDRLLEELSRTQFIDSCTPSINISDNSSSNYTDFVSPNKSKINSNLENTSYNSNYNQVDLNDSYQSNNMLSVGKKLNLYSDDESSHYATIDSAASECSYNNSHQSSPVDESHNPIRRTSTSPHIDPLHSSPVNVENSQSTSTITANKTETPIMDSNNTSTTGAKPANSSAKPRVGVCVSCDKMITGKMVTAMGYCWHVEHFICAHCQKPLGDTMFYEQNGHPYCEIDYQNLFSPRCAACNQLILQNCISALNKTWHPDHFVCAECGESFGDYGYHEKDGKAYCQKDYKRKFSKKCGGCGESICDTFITALNRHWHSTCFVCCECRRPFESGSFFEVGGNAYCETHYHSKKGTLCAACKQPINDRCITAMHKKFHPNHFVCSFCLNQLNKGTFKEHDDKPYCGPCFNKLFS